MNEVHFYGMIGLVMLTNLFYYWMATILEDKGNTYNYWFDHLKIYYNFILLIIKEENRKLKIKYLIIFCFSILFFGLFIFAGFKMIQMDN